MNSIRLLTTIALAFSLTACTVLFDTSIGRLVELEAGQDAVGDTTADTDSTDDGEDTGGTTDTNDVAAPDDGGDDDVDDVDGDTLLPTEDADSDADADVDGDTLTPIANRCGGVGPLLYRGDAAAPGDACGCGGALVCNGRDGLRCVGDTPHNACGGCAPISGEPGDDCGPCEDGVMVCDEGLLRCDAASARNLCGGCALLDGPPGAPCGHALDGTEWICGTMDRTECRPPESQNACGGSDPLEYEEAAAYPGQPCSTACGEGRLHCDPVSLRLVCDGPTVNACGGCGTLPAAAGADCGCEGRGRWVCDGTTTEMICSGGEHNECGGCGALPSLPGEECAGDGVRVCVSPTSVECVPRGDERNPCGGEATLRAEPGVACGSCDTGVYVCDGADDVACAGDRGSAAFNSCGGCEVLPGSAGDACGTCGAGVYECDGEEALACADDPGEDARNACGGCGTLPGVVDETCGTCAVWRCAGADMDCVYDWLDETCRVITCDDLDCEEENRECEPSAGTTDASCAGCLHGYAEEAGSCVVIAVCTDDGDPCETGDRCTVDTCQSGTCEAGPPRDCGAPTQCTAPSCDPALGCRTHQLTGNSCDDDNVCTVNDRCSDGRCVGGGHACEGRQCSNCLLRTWSLARGGTCSPLLGQPNCRCDCF